jgi:hypothetical protein
MCDKHSVQHINEDAVAERIIKKLEGQNQTRLSLGIQHINNGNKETTWDKILKYYLLPTVPVVLIGIFTIIWNMSSTIIRIESRLNNIERRFDAVENRLNDHELRLRNVENGYRK